MTDKESRYPDFKKLSFWKATRPFPGFFFHTYLTIKYFFLI